LSDLIEIKGARLEAAQTITKPFKQPAAGTVEGAMSLNLRILAYALLVLVVLALLLLLGP
jgi:hypothetical protein